jgi:3-deoxy-D-manno-octulosonic-acid transferase
MFFDNTKLIDKCLADVSKTLFVVAKKKLWPALMDLVAVRVCPLVRIGSIFLLLPSTHDT